MKVFCKLLIIKDKNFDIYFVIIKKRIAFLSNSKKIMKKNIIEE